MAEVETEISLHNNVFSDLDISVQEDILTRKIIFQGENTSLKDLLTPSCYVDFDDILDSNLLSKLDNNEEISVGTSLNALNQDIDHFYIPRNVCGGDITISEEQLCVVDDDSLWHVNIIDVPGSGKSTILDHLAFTMKKKNPSLWVIKIDFRNYADCLSKFKENKVKPVTVVDLLNSRPESRFKSDLERKTFSIPNKVVLMVDGLEEIGSEYEEIIDDIMLDYNIKPNLVKVCMTSSRDMDNNEMLVWPCHSLVPLCVEEQTILLKSYIEQTFGARKHDREKFKIYAEQIIAQKWFHEHENILVGVPLQIKMLSDIFCGLGNIDEVLSRSEDYYKFLSSNGSDSQPHRINLARLFLLYIHKNCCDDQSVLNVKSLRDDVREIVKKSRFSLYVIALEQTLMENHRKLFSSYTNRTQHDSDLLALGFVKKVGDSLRFSHKTIAEYFLTDCLVNELCQTENKEFFTFFTETLLTKPQYRLVRLFFEDIILSESNSISNNTLKNVGYMMPENPSTILHNLVRGGCPKTFKLIFKCLKLNDIHLDFDIIRSRRETLLQAAINAKQFDLMEFLVEKDVSVNSRDDDDRTALHHAVLIGNLKTVKFLVQHGAEIHCKDIRGCTPFQKATLSGSLDMMDYLLSNGAVFSTQGTVLNEAVRIGDMDKVRYLVEKGVDINLGKPIFDAVSEKHVDILKYLLERGADVTVRSANNGSLLHRISWTYGYGPKTLQDETIIEIIKLLIERGVDVNAVNEKGSTVISTYIDTDDRVDVIKYLVAIGADPKRKNKFNLSPLDWAIKAGAIKTVKYLMEMNVPYSNEFFRYIVHMGYLDVVKYLIEKGADFNSKIKDRFVLNTAINRNNMEMIKLLVETGADVNIEGMGTFFEITLLEDACEHCSLEVVKYLVKHGAVGEDALEYAAERGDLILVQYLEEQGHTASKIRRVGGNLQLLQHFVDKGISVDMTRVLNDAAIKGRLDIVRYLVGKGANVSALDYHKRSALHEAAKHDYLNIVTFLLRHGADIDSKDDKGETALDKAFRHYHLKVAKFLVDNGADFHSVLGENHEALHEHYYSFRKFKFLVDHCDSINIHEQPNSNVFDIALSNGCFNAVQCLVEKSLGSETIADIVKTLIDNKDGRLDDIFKRWETVRYLLEMGICIGKEEIEKYNLLIKAVSEGDVKYVKYLVEKGADVNQRNVEGGTPLHKASDFHIVKYLVSRGADVNAMTDDGWSVLHEAVKSGNFDVVKYLVENGADVNAVDKEGSMVIYTAAKSGSFSKFNYLLEKGALLTLHELSEISHSFIKFDEQEVDKYLIEGKLK